MKKLLFISLISFILTACGSGTSTQQYLDNARTAIGYADFNAALGELDLASAALSDSLASPTGLSELAVLYMTVNNHLDDGGDCSLKALEAYRRAVKISPDSVNEYIRTLDPEELQYIFILQSLSNSFDRSLDSVAAEDFEMELSEETELAQDQPDQTDEQ